MRGTSRIRVLLWKEALEISRDRKALITTILLPLIAMPAIGLLTVFLMVQQPVNIAVVDEDASTHVSPVFNITVSSRDLAAGIREHLSRSGFNVYMYGDKWTALSNSSIDLVVVIPRGFAENASSVDRVASVDIIRRANVQAAQQAEGTVRGFIDYYSAQLSGRKLEALAKLASVGPVDVNALRNPIVVGSVVLVSPSGAEVGAEEALKSLVARLLVLSFSFVVTPAASYVIDGVIGERERKTMEMLLTSPASVSEVFLSKLVAASMLGVLASLADLGGILAYVTLIIMAFGGGILVVMDPVLVCIHVVTAFLTILVTVSIATPFIARSSGLRSASNVAGIVSSIGLVFFIIGWMIDFPKLPPSIMYPLMLVPYTHSILAIQGYVYGELAVVARSLIVLPAVSLVSMIIAIRFIDKEKLLLARD